LPAAVNNRKYNVVDGIELHNIKLIVLSTKKKLKKNKYIIDSVV